METRVLIPEQLSIITSNYQSEKSSKSRSSTNKSAATTKNHSNRHNKEIEREKPTSSSGCEPESEDSEEKSSDETDCESETISNSSSAASSVRDRDKDLCSTIKNNQVNRECKTKESNEDSKRQWLEEKKNIGNDTKKCVVKICANQVISRGTIFSPNDGDVRVVYLSGVSQCPPDDIRFVFGCFDRITEDPLEENKQIRLCNWIRFVRRGKEIYSPSINIIARFSDRKPILEFTQTVMPGTELLAFFDIESITQDITLNIKYEKEETRSFKAVMVKSEFNGPDGPLDLTKSTAPLPIAKNVNQSNVNSNTSASLEKHFHNKIKTPTIFSITNVLQPIKLFQPYSNSSHREFPRTPPVSTTNLATPSSIGSSSPSATNSPTLRPILRTRGRERSLLPCEVCGKAFDRPSLLKRHMRTHTGEKPHICDVCSKGFSTSSSLNTHRRIHSGEKPHQCPICGKRFTASSNLYYHRMTHNKEKPHKCLLCGKSFPTPGDLKSHQYVHSGSWPYNCPICHRGFSKQTNLRNHLLLHSGDKPHTCQICGKKFALACNLRAHLRTHEEDPISSCISCKRTFLSSLNMLVNGQCRSCILHQTTNSTQSKILLSTEISPASNHSMTLQRTSPSVANGNGISVSPVSHSQNLNLAGIPGSGVVAPLPGFHLPGHPSSLFHGSIPDALSGFSRPNPFLEQLFEWNYRFAKETAGNLGLMQQKLLESQMLAAQLMSVSNTPGIGMGISDILRLRSPDYTTLDVANVNKFIQQ